MRRFQHNPRATRIRSYAAGAIGVCLIALVAALGLARSAGAAATAVPLGSATSFAILAGAGITNTGPTTVNGDIGTFPTTSFTGSASVTQTGVNHAGDSVTQDAKNALVTAYNNAAAQGPTSPIVGLTLGGKTLTRGVYNSGSTIDLTGTVTLDAQGDPDSIFVLQAGSALTTASSSSVALINGAQSCNVFWQIGSDATIGVGSTFVGTLLVQNSIVLKTGAVVTGRVLASVGSVTLDTNTIAKPGCTSSASTPAPGPASSPDRTIYCQGGTAWNLVIGQDKVAPYDALGLTPAFVDPVTGALTCSVSTPPTTTATTTTTTTTATTPTSTTPTPTGPTAKQIAAAKAKRLAAVKAARIAKAKQVAAAKSRNIVKKTPKPKPKTAVHSFGFTG